MGASWGSLERRLEAQVNSPKASISFDLGGTRLQYVGWSLRWGLRSASSVFIRDAVSQYLSKFSVSQENSEGRGKEILTRLR